MLRTFCTSLLDTRHTDITKVCTDQKAKRDECMLFSTSNDAQKECAPLIDQYKQCMAGYGFKI